MKRFRRIIQGSRIPNRIYEKKYRGIDFDEIYNAFVEALYFVPSVMDEDEEEEMQFLDLSSSAEKRIKNDIHKFIKLAGEDTIKKYCNMVRKTQFISGEEKLGHNFYYARHGHGAGFFDDDYIYSKKLDKISQKFNELYPYIEDGEIKLD